MFSQANKAKEILLELFPAGFVSCIDSHSITFYFNSSLNADEATKQIRQLETKLASSQCNYGLYVVYRDIHNGVSGVALSNNPAFKITI